MPSAASRSTGIIDMPNPIAEAVTAAVRNADGPISIVELCGTLGLTNGQVRSILKRLADAGQIEFVSSIPPMGRHPAFRWRESADA